MRKVVDDNWNKIKSGFFFIVLSGILLKVAVCVEAQILESYMFAAIYCILYGFVAAVGISFLQFTNSNSIRNIYVLGVSLFLGTSVPQYFVMNTDVSGHGPVRTNAGWFNDILNTIFSSPPTVALIVGTILDNTLEAHHAYEDRGLPWFVPFQSWKGDSRNEEFYSYPLRINEYIPSRFL
ncbi:nucleobase-ascorbate transporter 3-like [Primulina huaijiensis]|uniref:nucleobase-ascorbate transporter 3-like n=1 Tax=Primulina huaijiensis TaxID=1492673 RepID=UPI003CC73F02